jgi:asparagine synthase (glutamine-hydrolysing)
MCGIVGILTPRPGLDKGVIDAMRDRLAHRGPDGKGSWLGASRAGGSVGLGHRRLSIIDLSAAADQPFLSGDGRCVLVFNGEIYNYVELRDELRQAGVSFRTEGDTEVLLAAYRRWGTDCLSHLNGMFAFLLWDGDRDELFVARDRFGEKPLYMARLPEGGAAFASEAKALFAVPGVAAVADIEEVERFLRGGTLIHGARTLFAGVTRLPGAHALVLDGAGRELRRWRYWTPDYSRIRRIAPRDAVAEFRDRLRRSVAMRMRSDVQVGACLSGGLDSSTLVGYLAAMAPHGGPSIGATYSARFDDDPTVSEGDFIDKVLQSLHLRSCAVSPTAAGFVAEARRLYWHQEIPFLSPSIYLEWSVLRHARETGTTVMIDGQGADELLGGYPSFFTLRQKDQIEARSYVRALRESRAVLTRYRQIQRQYAESDRRFSVGHVMDWRQLLALARTGSQRPQQPPEARAGVAVGLGHFRTQLSGYLLHDSLPDQLHSADRSAMAFGVETRFPFLDYELVDWCISLPDDVMIRDGWQKWILREAAQGAIPDEVRWRVDKVGYRAPQDRWIRSGMRDWMAERLLGPDMQDVPGYDATTAEVLWRQHDAGESDNSWILFRWASTAEWLAMLREGIWRDGMPAGPDRARQAGVVETGGVTVP